MKKNSIAFLIVIISLFSLCCKNENPPKRIIRDTSITPATSFNNLFLDSIQIESFLSKHGDDSTYRDQFFNFYKHRNYEYAWFDTSGITEEASNFMNLVNSTMMELHDSSLYNKKLNDQVSSYISDSTKHREKAPVETELSLTAQFFKYAAKVYAGSDIDTTELGWFIPRKKINPSALLDSVILTKGKLDGKLLPMNGQYNKLVIALEKYYDIQKNDPWDSIPRPVKAYKRKDSGPEIAQIKKRLYELGDLTWNDTTMHFDTALVNAAKSFQRRMGLQDDGVIGSQFIDELNYPVAERIKQILINLERTRWMPAESDSNYIVVNIPDYKLFVFDSGSLQFNMNVIVGTAANSTVIFTGALKYIVFSPYWNVPLSIVQKEILPAMQKDHDYLSKHNMEITGYDNKIPVIRQKPGKDNSLGNVKFLFPNNFNIYLHDTPNHELFSSEKRTFSHGCIRIQDPTKMALYLLRDQPWWTPQRVDSCMHLPAEKWVTIKNPVRVYIGYFTAWVDNDGKLNFRKDIYGHDAKMAEKLFVNNNNRQAAAM